MFKHNDDLVDYVQQHHALTVLFALHHIPSPSWRLVKEYALGELGAGSLSDKCYRDRCKELVTLELARYVKRDPLKNDYYLTQHGHEAATEMERAFESVERWRTRALDKNESRAPDRSIDRRHALMTLVFWWSSIFSLIYCFQLEKQSIDRFFI